MSKLQRAKDAAKRARELAKANKQMVIRRATNGVSGYMLGKAAASGSLERVPSILGAPRIATVGLLGWAVAWYGSGEIADAAEGVVDMSIGVASFKYGAGEEVAGATVAGPTHVMTTARELAELEADLAGGDVLDMDGQVPDFDASYEAELAELMD